jgi:hypothetical protein
MRRGFVRRKDSLHDGARSVMTVDADRRREGAQGWLSKSEDYLGGKRSRFSISWSLLFR